MEKEREKGISYFPEKSSFPVTVGVLIESEELPLIACSRLQENDQSNSALSNQHCSSSGTTVRLPIIPEGSAIHSSRQTASKIYESLEQQIRRLNRDELVDPVVRSQNCLAEQKGKW
jgi:hypothetical protein